MIFIWLFKNSKIKMKKALRNFGKLFKSIFPLFWFISLFLMFFFTEFLTFEFQWSVIFPFILLLRACFCSLPEMLTVLIDVLLSIPYLFFSCDNKKNSWKQKKDVLFGEWIDFLRGKVDWRLKFSQYLMESNHRFSFERWAFKPLNWIAEIYPI